MSCWTLIPIKSRALRKSRLRDALPPAARLRLTDDMLVRAVAAASSCEAVDRMVLVSPDCDELPPHMRWVRDSGVDLNAALDLARHNALRCGATEILVLLADLPNVTAADLDALIRVGRRAGIAIAPDTAEVGTNALFLSRSRAFEFAFGPASCERHRAEASRLGISVAICRRPGLALDLDTPEDLIAWRAAHRADPVALQPETAS